MGRRVRESISRRFISLESALHGRRLEDVSTSRIAAVYADGALDAKGGALHRVLW